MKTINREQYADRIVGTSERVKRKEKKPDPVQAQLDRMAKALEALSKRETVVNVPAPQVTVSPPRITVPEPKVVMPPPAREFEVVATKAGNTWKATVRRTE